MKCIYRLFVQLPMLAMLVMVVSCSSKITMSEFVSDENHQTISSNKLFNIQQENQRILRGNMPTISPCTKNCLTRQEQISQKGFTNFLPLFLKLHKVGSGTISDLMRRHCQDIANRIKSSEDVTEEDALITWRGGKFCGMSPHSHSSLTMYHGGGVEAFQMCAQYAQPVRLYTVLRNPIEKFLSGLYFWKRGIEEEMMDKLHNSPFTITVKDIEDLLIHIHSFGTDRSGQGRGGVLFQYHYVLARMKEKEKDHPTPLHTEAACNALRRDFTVGTTEHMDSLIVLIALENGWPLEEMCYFNSHVNKDRPHFSNFSSEVREYLNNLFADETKIWKCAHEIHLEQGSRFANFTEAVEMFKSTSFKDKCGRIKSHYVKSDNNLTKEEIRVRNKCFEVPIKNKKESVSALDAKF